MELSKEQQISFDKYIGKQNIFITGALCRNSLVKGINMVFVLWMIHVIKISLEVVVPRIFHNLRVRENFDCGYCLDIKVIPAWMTRFPYDQEGTNN